MLFQGAGADTSSMADVNIMDYVVSAHCLEGLVTTIGGDHEGVALW